jgi:hypothetical protein
VQRAAPFPGGFDKMSPMVCRVFPNPISSARMLARMVSFGFVTRVAPVTEHHQRLAYAPKNRSYVKRVDKIYNSEQTIVLYVIDNNANHKH